MKGEEMIRINENILGSIIAGLLLLLICVGPATAEDNFIRISNGLHLYSGDNIHLIANDGSYVKRFYQIKGHSALISEPIGDPSKLTVKDPTNFTVVVVGSNKIHLIANNGYYCKRFYDWRKMSFFTMDKPRPDNSSVFYITPLGGDKIAIQANNGQYLKRYYAGDKKKSIITAYRKTRDQSSVFTIMRTGTNCREEVKKVEFYLDRATKDIKPYVLTNEEFINDSPIEQTMVFKVSETVATEKAFYWSKTFQIGVEVSFKTNIPILASNEIKMSMSKELTKGGEERVLNKKNFENTFPLNCPPNSTLKATAIVQKGIIDVPYRATVVRTVEDGAKNKYHHRYFVDGIYHAVNYFDLKRVVEKVQ
jgi:hypothetical protein